jgi:iron(III) transport system ATP-binding protein
MNVLSTQPQRSGAKDINIKGVNLYYGDFHALKDIDLKIQPGEFFAFLGPSGCGKTTLLRLIAGFNAAQTGSIQVSGEELLKLPPWKRDVGMVFQSYALWPHMTVFRNVAFGLEERKLPAAEIKRRVANALEVVGLTHLAERRPSQLSGGQQQRVALARTIAIEPKVLLLDEPLSNLDAKMRVQVRRELRDLQQRLGLTTIFVTHDQEEANTMCDRIAVFNDGVIQQVGTPMELYTKPANLFVANFLGTANILSGNVRSNNAERAFVLADGTAIAMPADAPGGPVKLVFRPQNARLGGAAPGDVQLTGTVANVEFLGASLRYQIKVGSEEVLVDVPFLSGTAIMTAGHPVDLGLAPSSILWIAA